MLPSQLLDEMELSAVPKPLMKGEHRLTDVLTAPRGKLHPVSILFNGDYSISVCRLRRHALQQT